MYIELEKPTNTPTITLGCVVIAKSKATSRTMYYLIVKHNVTFSALNLETYKVGFSNLPAPEDVLKGIALNGDIIEILSPEQTLLTRKDVN